MSLWNDESLRKIFSTSTLLIDVRAPVEFSEGTIPHSINLPILNDDERALVGTCFKKEGQHAAIELGHKLVSGAAKTSRVMAWNHFLEKYPSAEIFCFRGGLRSQKACEWLGEMGIHKQPIPGGYKRMRQFFLSLLNDAPLPSMIRIGGPTGSGKTTFLRSQVDILDLERFANHRGSAFGYQGRQPAQITFENELALELMKLEGRKILVEDESATIGKITIPRRLFLELRNSPMIILKVDLEERITNIHADYVKGSTSDILLSSLDKIQKSLGGMNYKLVRDEMLNAFKQGTDLKFHEGWIHSLLKHYYDPHYFRDLNRQPGKILASGTFSEIKNFLASR